MKAEAKETRHKTYRRLPYDIEPVRGYPDVLQIYRTDASRFYQVRYFINGKYKIKTTRCTDKKKAIEFDKNFFHEILLQDNSKDELHTYSFGACAMFMIEHNQSLISRGERDARLLTEDEKKLRKDILPYYKNTKVSEITTSTIEEYMNSLLKDRALSPSTLSKHIGVIRKVLTEARKRDYVKTLPIFPTVKKKDNPRPFFDVKEYRKLREKARSLAQKDLKVRGVPFTSEMYEFILFSTNVFIRPSDTKLLKHKHVTIEKEDNTQFLLIVPPNSKTVTRESASMASAVDAYERLLKIHKAQGYADDDDYVFFPQYPNREYALATLRRQFEFVLNESKLSKDKYDRKRTIYSLRHTALMYRLLYGDNVDIFLLARNALTSVDQLERFYLSHAESRMKIGNLQSMASKRS